MTNNFSKIKQSDIPDMVKLKRKGLSFGKIGRKFNINPSTVFHHIKKSGMDYPKNKTGIKSRLTPEEIKKHNRLYYRKWYKKNGRKKTDSCIEGVKKWIAKHPKEVFASRKLNRAIFNGKIIKPIKCSRCYRKTKLVGHHDDYDKPLKVKWLCHSCHKIIHNQK